MKFQTIFPPKECHLENAQNDKMKGGREGWRREGGTEGGGKEGFESRQLA